MYGQGQPMLSDCIGGHGGSQHQFMQPTYSLIGVRGKCGGLIDNIQFLFVDINTGQFAESGRYGGNGGNHFEYIAPHGAWIDSVKVTSSNNNMISSLEF